LKTYDKSNFRVPRQNEQHKREPLIPTGFPLKQIYFYQQIIINKIFPKEPSTNRNDGSFLVYSSLLLTLLAACLGNQFIFCTGLYDFSQKTTTHIISFSIQCYQASHTTPFRQLEISNPKLLLANHQNFL